MSSTDVDTNPQVEAESSPPAKKICLQDDEGKEIPKEEKSVREEPSDVPNDESRETTSNDKLKLQQQESARRENVLVMRLATKEQEMQDLMAQIHELKQAQTPSTNQLRSTLIDPAVNLLFETMKNELEESNKKLEQAQNDLNAWKFTPDSVTGKKLMAKCRMLFQENQDLGRQLSQGRVAQLEAELALQKKYGEELKSSQDEMNDFVIQLDEEVEGLQSTIYALQQELKETKRNLTQSKESSKHVDSKTDAESVARYSPKHDIDVIFKPTPETLKSISPMHDTEISPVSNNMTLKRDSLAEKIEGTSKSIISSSKPDSLTDDIEMSSSNLTSDPVSADSELTLKPLGDKFPLPAHDIEIASKKDNGSSIQKVGNSSNGGENLPDDEVTAASVESFRKSDGLTIVSSGQNSEDFNDALEAVSPVYIKTSFSISTLLSPEKLRTKTQDQSCLENDNDLKITIDQKCKQDSFEVTSCNGDANYDEQLSPTV